MRRYDIDWLRVIAIGLLLIYHIAIGFQSWGIMIGFINTKQPWGALWAPMTMLNVWRIPLLFFVSGMGVYFAMQQRNWKELIKERTFRIWLPFVFGMFAIVPIHRLIWREYYNMSLTYAYGPDHLWFLANIFAYVLLFAPLFFYFKRNENGKTVRLIKKVFSSPLGLVLVVLAFIAEAIIIKPIPYELYAMTLHGFVLGLLAFFFGFCFVLSGDAFWAMIRKWRWVLLGIAASLFVYRLMYFNPTSPVYWLVIESQCWIFSVLAFGNKHLNFSNKALPYLSQAAYPVYILHMIFLYLGSSFVFRMDITAPFQFMLISLITFAGCFGSFEIIRRINFLRPMFGLKMKPKVSHVTQEKQVASLQV